jgi:hypothetical protein
MADHLTTMPTQQSAAYWAPAGFRLLSRRQQQMLSIEETFIFAS